MNDIIRNTSRDAGVVKTEDVRWDELRLTDTILHINWDGNVVSVFVSEIQLIGDDIEINSGEISSSQGNLVTRLFRPIIEQ